MSTKKDILVNDVCQHYQTWVQPIVASITSLEPPDDCTPWVRDAFVHLQRLYYQTSDEPSDFPIYPLPDYSFVSFDSITSACIICDFLVKHQQKGIAYPDMIRQYQKTFDDRPRVDNRYELPMDMTMFIITTKSNEQFDMMGTIVDVIKQCGAPGGINFGFHNPCVRADTDDDL